MGRSISEVFSDLPPTLKSTATQLTGSVENLTGSNDLPSTTFNSDGKYWDLPLETNTADIVLRNSSGVPVHTTADTDVNTETSNTMVSWAGNYWLDSSDTALWFITMNSSTVGDLMKLPEAGVLSHIGTFTLTTALTTVSWNANFHSQYCGLMERAAHGSGNFTVNIGGYTFTLSSADGSVVSQNTPIASDESYLMADVSNYASLLDYTTEDGTLSCGGIFSSVTDDSYISALYNATTGMGATYLDITRISSTASKCNPTLWLDKIILASTSVSYARYSSIIYYTRAEFDNWLKGVAKHYGI